jgi:hypothetical protein
VSHGDRRLAISSSYDARVQRRSRLRLPIAYSASMAASGRVASRRRFRSAFGAARPDSIGGRGVKPADVDCLGLIKTGRSAADWQFPVSGQSTRSPIIGFCAAREGPESRAECCERGAAPAYGGLDLTSGIGRGRWSRYRSRRAPLAYRSARSLTLQLVVRRVRLRRNSGRPGAGRTGVQRIQRSRTRWTCGQLVWAYG